MEDPAVVEAKRLWAQKQPGEAVRVLVTRINELNAAVPKRQAFPFMLAGLLGGIIITVLVGGILLVAFDLLGENNDQPGAAIASNVTETFTPISPTRTLIPTWTPVPTITTIPSSTPAPARDTSDIFDAQMTQLLEKGSLLGAMTSQGVNYINYERQLVEVKGTYDFISTIWPSGFALGAQEQFDKAFEGWDLALELWGLKLDDMDNPVEPNINGYLRYTDYAGDELYIAVHPSNFIVPEYRDKQYLPFDENIGILFSLGSEYFEAGQKTVLTEWP
ncbi:MAG TPA: hypothetical protein PKD09_10460 [Aggregatilinea sp.]|uniref:hypothetical protein n=1 Tax=Aggregatilinea sp. TaxID=2806333 RepID=UPI002B95B137|nr:hypothetical protein [Aggregatilinea sp.]HML22064.1 hypothetical protein [Aggregatilinea sp.]